MSDNTEPLATDDNEAHLQITDRPRMLRRIGALQMLHFLTLEGARYFLPDPEPIRLTPPSPYSNETPRGKRFHPKAEIPVWADGKPANAADLAEARRQRRAEKKARDIQRSREGGAR